MLAASDRSTLHRAGGTKAQIGYVHNWMRYEAKYPVSFSAAWVLPAVRHRVQLVLCTLLLHCGHADQLVA